MSFRVRLISFFLVIVLVPMLAVGALVFRLIGDSGQARAQARASGLLAAASSLYGSDQDAARGDAAALARVAATTPPQLLDRKLRTVLARAGVVRIEVTQGRRVVAELGSASAVAPGSAVYKRFGRTEELTVSTTTASGFVTALAPEDLAIIRSGRKILGSSVPGAAAMPSSGRTRIGKGEYEVATSGPLQGFEGPVRLSVLSATAVTAGSMTSSRVVAAIFLGGFVLLALAFAMLASRGLQNQVKRFLLAARRLASGDFSAPVPVEGSDEFALLATAFNDMSAQLEQRLGELESERHRLRESIRRAGETFGSNLDPAALPELTLRTAIDAVEGSFGRLSARLAEEPLKELVHVGSPEADGDAVLQAEREALRERAYSEIQRGEVHVAAVPLEAADTRLRGVISVGRRGRPFGSEDRELFGWLASQIAMALDNVQLHREVQRRAVTDQLTGLANHGRFQELLSAEMEEVRRYQHPVGLIMIDLDNFKQINDTFGHPQGDLVLRNIARVLEESSREADRLARYGGEELAVILPHTDLEGAYAIAERIRLAVAELRLPILGDEGTLKVTASLGVAASTNGDKERLIHDADTALYEAKRGGKNRSVKATRAPVNVAGAG